MKKMLVLLLSGVILSGVSVVSAQVLEEQKGDYYEAVKLLYVDKNFNEALNKVNALLEQTPDSAELYSLRAQIYEDMENKRAALADFEQAIKVNPKNSSAFSMRACVKIAKGELKSANEDLEIANKLLEEEEKEATEQKEKIKNPDADKGE